MASCDSRLHSENFGALKPDVGVPMLLVATQRSWFRILRRYGNLFYHFEQTFLNGRCGFLFDIAIGVRTLRQLSMCFRSQF